MQIRSRAPKGLGTPSHGRALSEKKAEALLQRWLDRSGLSLDFFYKFNHKGYFKGILETKSLSEKFGESPRIKLESLAPQTPLKIMYGVAPSPFGECFIALAGNKICQLSFLENESKNNSQSLTMKGHESYRSRPAVLAELSRSWPKADIYEAPDSRAYKRVASLVADIFYSRNKSFRLLVHGSALQLKVWQALIGLQKGTVAAYSQLAQYIGRPRAVRPVAGAVARNPISYLVPCHRVIAKSGRPHAYHWGKERKFAMLLWEAALLP